MVTITSLYILSGVVLVWLSAEKLERYSIASASKYGISPFLIGSTIIAFGTSAPEMLTSLFAVLDNKPVMVVGNVIGSNIANIALVFGLTLGILSIKSKNISSTSKVSLNLFILILSTFLLLIIIALDPFNFYSSIILLISLIIVLLIWYKKSDGKIEEKQTSKEKLVLFKLILSLISLIFAAWLITQGALNILNNFGLEQLFVGYTVLAIGTSIPEIAASFALTLKGRYEAVAGTIIGSNIFNGLLVMAIPGLFNRNNILPTGFEYQNWIPLLLLLLAVTIIFCIYIFLINKRERKASKLLAIFLISSYFLSLALAYK